MHNWKIQIIGLFINFLVPFNECAPKHLPIVTFDYSLNIRQLYLHPLPTLVQNSVD